jgi:ubiquitin-protein ligase
MAKTANYAVNGAATKALQQELKSLQKEPLEGFTVQLLNDNIFEWEVAIFGPPNTLYQGGYFKVIFTSLISFKSKNLTFSSKSV